jgi:hypothetical protein
MKLTADLEKGRLTVNDNIYNISCRVRTVKNGTRRLAEVIRTIPNGFPYDPQTFPKGLWNITGIEWQKDKGFDLSIYGTVKIRTNAFQMVNVWELDQDGDYLRETEKQVKDEGYLIHYSISSTTLGCIRAESQTEIETYAQIIERELVKGGEVLLEVI